MKKFFLSALALVLALSQQAVSQTVSKQIVNTMTAGKYTMKFRSEQTIGGETLTFEAVQHVSGGKMALAGKQGDHSVKIVVSDGKAYMIDETSKKIFTMPSVSAARDMGFNAAGFKFNESGREIFLGRNLPYDEYIINGGSVRVYVGNGKLAGFKVMEEGIPAIVEVTDFSGRVDDSVFNLPAGYAFVPDNGAAPNSVLTGEWEYVTAASTTMTYEFTAGGVIRIKSRFGDMEGTYAVDGDKLTVTIQGSSSVSTFELNGDSLTITDAKGTAGRFTRSGRVDR